MKNLVLIILLGICISACQENGAVISGKAENYEGRIVILEEQTAWSYSRLDTFVVDNNNNFKIPIKKPGNYRLNFNYAKRIPVMVSSSDFELIVDAGSRRGKYEIIGSPDHDLVNEVDEINSEFNALPTVKKISQEYADAVHEKDMDKLDLAKAKYKQARQEKDKLIKEMVLEALDAGAYIGVIEVMTKRALEPLDHVRFYRKVADELNKAIPDNKAVEQFEIYVRKIEETKNS
ncbi:MAG: DUF4369 domain-containing protein [Fulvivirga sp.]|nr:DUF4369 domain-containing protein [Fulvivirga sp.]